MAEPSTQRRKREKPILSCSFCRSRKLRCDRQSPCGACVRRGKATECTFSASEQERSHAVDYRPHARRQQARQRVARLEDLVTEMRNQMQTAPGLAAPAVPTTANSPSGIADDMGKLSLTDDQAVYTGSSHWVTILEDIQRLKDELEDDPATDAVESEQAEAEAEAGPLSSQSSVSRISLLNSGPALSKEQILSVLPPRETADKFVSNFFEYFDMAPFILHRSKFMSEYVRFWENPTSISILWLSILFGVLSISSFLSGHDNQEDTVVTNNMVQTYRAMAIHCLIAGDYLRPRQYTIEALILHFAIDQIVNVDGTVSNWVLMGVVVRLALRMGLHRDPSHWPSIRPLQAELRRRLWISLYQIDFFTSVQVGLSRIIKDAQCDTQPPSHLAGQDLSLVIGAADNDSTLKPTPPLFIVQRNGIVKVAAAIYDATEEQPGPSPDALSALSAQLEVAISSVPAAFTYTSFEESIVDGPIITLHRVVLDILIQKTVYLLHRRSFNTRTGMERNSDSDSQTFVSQDKCIQAALAILEHQERLGRETVPGGHLFDIRWKVAASLNHEALQAAMMLCFALSSFESTWPQRAVSHSVDEEIRNRITNALAQVKVQWEAKPELSAETQKALQAVTAVQKRNQKGLKSKEQAHGQLPDFRTDSSLPALSTLQDDANFFDPMLAFQNSESFDFTMFDFGGSVDPASTDPLLYDSSFEFEGPGGL